MKIISDLLESVKPHFEKGGALEVAAPLFEATESFLFTSDEVTGGRTHIRDFLDSKRLMTTVIVALIPCTLMAMYNTGMQRLIATNAPLSCVTAVVEGAIAFFPLYIVTVSVGILWEVIFASVRKHEINEGFLVTSLLFPLILPPTLPLWQVAIGISFGVVIGKEVFGGTGMNIMNPALTARVFLFFTYPGNMSGDSVWVLIDKTKDTLVDGFSGATPLGVAAAVEKGNSIIAGLDKAGYTFSKLFLGTIPGSMGETSALACLIGAAILIYAGIASWRTMAGCAAGAAAVTLLMNIVAGPQSNPMLTLPFYYHFVMGGFAFGAVFMATDPVSSAVTDAGKWIYGACIGGMAVMIRCVNPAYPEGMMLAILFMNVFAPLIDHFVAQANIKRRLNRAAQ